MNMETIPVTPKGVEKLITQLNKIHKGINASAEYKNGVWILDIAGQIHIAERILEAIKYLQGVKLGIKIMKNMDATTIK